MIEILLILACGMIIGRLLRGWQPLVFISRNITVTVCCLVGSLGFIIGADTTLTESLPSIGLTGLILAVAGTAGSILGAMLITRFLKTKK